MDEHFEAERHRLRQEMKAAIEQVRTTYRSRLDAVDRAEKLMKFAESGERDPAADAERTPHSSLLTGSLRDDLARFVAGRSETFSLSDVEARLPGIPPKEIRTCLGQMAKEGVVSIVEAGEAGQPTRYEVPEPDYAGVPRREPAGDPPP